MPRWWRGTLRSGGVRHIGAPPMVRRPRGTLDFGAGKPLHASILRLAFPRPGEMAARVLVVGQDSLADVLGDVQDRREAPQCGDFSAGWEDTAKTYGGVRCL